jgi:hypothetical protein
MQEAKPLRDEALSSPQPNPIIFALYTNRSIHFPLVVTQWQQYQELALAAGPAVRVGSSAMVGDPVLYIPQH